MSPKSAGLAVKWGHNNPLVYIEGQPAWNKKGNRTVPALDYIENGSVVIIDLRDPAKVEGGHIPKAYSIPFATFMDEAEFVLPKALGAPIYLYSDSDKDIDAARKEAREVGYKSVYGFYNALESWTAGGKQLQQGPALAVSDDEPIAWERKLGVGEISITDFTKSLQSDLIHIVDTRTAVEYDTGHFPGAVNIPLEELDKRMAEIPMNKFVVVHCKTGARGEMGYKMLREAGYTVKYLNAECECMPSGEFEIW